MSDLQRQLAELRAAVEALQPSHQAEGYLAQVFAEAKFAPHLEHIIAHLCGAAPSYSFVVEADPAEDGHPTQYTALWYDRAEPPIVIQYTRRWRGMPGELPEPRSYELMEEPPAQATTALVRTSHHLAASEQTVNAPAASVEPSDLLRTSAQGHSEQPPKPPARDQAEIAAEIARIEAEIARLTAAESAPTQSSQPSTASVSVSVSQSARSIGEYPSAGDWMKRLF